MTHTGDLEEFRLVRPLGRGGMGEVFLGHDTVLDRAVAIKVISSAAPDAASRERFLTEARAIARLSHPNVVAIYRVGTTSAGRPFLVQELIRGVSLDRMALPIGWRQVCELAIGIARGLAAAHRRGIVHRDVKPANVMIDESGTARLLDFGLAKLSALAEAPAPGPLGTWPGISPVAPTTAAPAEEPRRAAPSVAVTADVAPEAEAEAVAATADPRPGLARSTGAAGYDGAPLLAVGGADPLATTAPRSAGLAVTSPHAERDAALTAAAVETASGSPRAGVDGVDVPTATAPGSVVGTPRYAAPEVWRGEPATARSDLYSLGAMLYELVSGSAPYPQTRIPELRAAALAGGASSIEAVVPDIEPALARLIMACLALDPSGRPSSAAAVAHELEAMIVGAPIVGDGNPYRGLRAFAAEHRGVFFGRGADVDVLVDRLRSEHLVVVVGDSGIGKSSVCHAGVVPAVLAGGLGDRRRWRAQTVAPGPSPWTALCEALALDPVAAQVPADQLARALRPGGDLGLLLVVDQLEELVTLGDAAEAARTAELLAAIADGVPGVKAVVAVRGDYLTRVAALPELGAAMARGLHLLRVLSPADLREAVVGPARARGVRFETEAMVDALVAAVAGNPGALPLLQFTLAELWQARDAARGVIPARALAELGGVDGGLAGHADAVLLALTADERAAARRVVLRLVSATQTRAVRDRDELTGGDPVAAAALEALVRGRIVAARDTIAGAPSYELAHEALIRSWGTLRDWLDDAAGQHAARNRLQASAAEWQRLGRRADLLWTRGQLDELRARDSLTAEESAFLAASRGRERRRRVFRLASIAAAPVVALAIFVGVRLEAARSRADHVATRLAAAAVHQVDAVRLAGLAGAARDGAFARFDTDDNVGGEAWWSEARRLGSEARARFGDAEAELEAAFVLDAEAVRAPMAAVLWADAELAEAEHDPDRVADRQRRLRAYDPARAATWNRPGRLIVALDRPGALSVHAFSPDATGPTIAGGFLAEPVARQRGARLEAELPPGSYVTVIEMPDGHVVRDPVLLGRGERLERVLEIPPKSAVPPGFVWVPPGRFLYGAAGDESVRRDQLGAQPLRRVATPAYMIGRHEVTHGEWLTYVRDLEPKERLLRVPRGVGIQVDEIGGRYRLVLRPTADAVHSSVEGVALSYSARTMHREVRWENSPVSGISPGDALTYVRWLTLHGVRGARLCTQLEWERAARGADGRAYPHGERLRPVDANFDETFGRVSLAFGPDEVGRFPASDSPFGISDLVGNVWEWTIDSRGNNWYRGGSFYQGKVTALSNNANRPAERSQRDLKIGLRVCADAK